MEQFQPNANNILDVLYNKKPKYLPQYEQHISLLYKSDAADDKCDV